MEAVIGAVFLDGGIEAAKRVILDHVIDTLERASVDALDRDYKTRLQEHVQHSHMGKLQYVLTDSAGPEHRKEFTMTVYLDGAAIGSGKGGNKQSAGQAAAADALERLTGAHPTERE